MKLCRDVWLPDSETHMLAEIQLKGGFNTDRLHQVWPYVKKWRTAVDVGAHAGTWSRCFAHRFQRVIAFEPSAETYECLSRNVYNWKLSNVEPRCEALGADHGRGTSMSNGRDENTGGRWVKAGEGNVPIITLDSLELHDLDLLKVDAEGMDVEVLKGALETLKRCKPVVVWEDKPKLMAFHHIREEHGPAWLLTKLGARYLTHAKRDRIWGWEK